MKAKTVKQCQTCPWKVGCNPQMDIQNGYSVELHEGLRKTIATPGDWHGSKVAMACHHSKPGREFACAGWLANQIGPGNNIAARVQVMRGNLPVPEVDGPQHQTFDDTLPKRAKR